ncbi:MAG: LCP family protein [Solirubrobacterales bacterium]|nr:LCP family protein [Solirubrobacterales bacterium]
MKLLPNSRRGLLGRALLAAVLVIGLTVTATTVGGVLQFKQIGQLIGKNAFGSKNVVLPKPGAPETILLIGSDWRHGEPQTATHTDTMMLLRLNDRSQTVNAMSVPRDLEVQNPQTHRPIKLNGIYSLPGSQGGPDGLLSVLRKQVFPKLQVNHVIDVNFSGFSDLVDAIGCVYSQVDHRYYNVSSPPGTPDNYSSINIQPGYQPLCGHHLSSSGALPFVRFRHTDSDKVRNARQQDFIRWARTNYSANDMVSNQGTLERIFGQHARTDRSLGSIDGLVDLFNLVVGAQSGNLSMKTISFPQNFGNCDGKGQCYSYACPTTAECGGQVNHGPPIGHSTEAERAAYKSFIAAIPGKPKKAKPSPPPKPKPKPKASKHGGAKHHGHAKSPPASKLPAGVSPAGLVADGRDGQLQARQLKHVPFPVYYPNYVPRTANYCISLTDNCVAANEPAQAYAHSYPRYYKLLGSDHKRYASYVMTLDVNAALGQYMTVEGTKWQNAPILRDPDHTVNLGGRQLDEYMDGSKLALVAWRTSNAVYWVSNTLDNAIPASQMLGMAATLTGPSH